MEALRKAHGPAQMPSISNTVALSPRDSNAMTCSPCLLRAAAYRSSSCSADGSFGRTYLQTPCSYATQERRTGSIRSLGPR